MDPITDYMALLRSAIKAKDRVVEVPASNMKKRLTEILFEKGYIVSYKVEEKTPQSVIKMALKYSYPSKEPAIMKLERISRSGLRKYASADRLPRVLNGLGIAILSTSKGVMSDKEARMHNVGGEVLCYIY